MPDIDDQLPEDEIQKDSPTNSTALSDFERALHQLQVIIFLFEIVEIIFQ